MSTSVVNPNKGFVLNSTNGIGNILMLLLLAAAAAFGIGEDMVTALVSAAIPVGFFVREIVEGKRKARWSGNIATYLASAIILVAPWLEGILNATTPIVDEVANGNPNAIWGMLIPVVNEILILVRNKPWQPATA